jgi:hypothetical protein
MRRKERVSGSSTRRQFTREYTNSGEEKVSWVEEYTKSYTNLEETIQADNRSEKQPQTAQPPSANFSVKRSWLQFWLGVLLTGLISLVFFLLR